MISWNSCVSCTTTGIYLFLFSFTVAFNERACAFEPHSKGRYAIWLSNKHSRRLLLIPNIYKNAIFIKTSKIKTQFLAFIGKIFEMFISNINNNILLICFDCKFVKFLSFFFCLSICWIQRKIGMEKYTFSIFRLKLYKKMGFSFRPQTMINRNTYFK